MASLVPDNLCKLNYPITTPEAKAMWASRHKCNRMKAIIAFSLNLANANDNLRRAGYTLQWRKKAIKAFKTYVNKPTMAGVPFSQISTPWWECMPVGDGGEPIPPEFNRWTPNYRGAAFVLFPPFTEGEVSHEVVFEKAKSVTFNGGKDVYIATNESNQLYSSGFDEIKVNDVIVPNNYQLSLNVKYKISGKLSAGSSIDKLGGYADFDFKGTAINLSFLSETGGDDRVYPSVLSTSTKPTTTVLIDTEEGDNGTLSNFPMGGWKPLKDSLLNLKLWVDSELWVDDEDWNEYDPEPSLIRWVNKQLDRNDWECALEDIDNYKFLTDGELINL